MTLEIGFLLAVIGVMVALFLTEKLPVDLTAFTGLAVLVFTGYLSPQEAFTGFSSAAVITMLSIFIVSAALLQTGVADLVGGRVHALVGGRENRLVALIMIVAGLLSAFMNNIAATAVLMPAVATIAKRASLPPSRLFMPLSFGAVLGGTTTMVGTPPNILAAEVLRERGLEPFALFDFSLLGLLLLGVGTVYMITIGKRLLGAVASEAPGSEARQLLRLYGLEEHTVTMRVPESSPLDGRTLGESRLGTALGAQVMGIRHDGRENLAPSGDTVVHGGDVLTIQGKKEDLEELLRVKDLEVEETEARDLPAPSREVTGFRGRVREGSSLAGRSLGDLRFRERFGVVVVGIQREERLQRERLASVVLRPGDEIFAQGSLDALAALRASEDFVGVQVGLGALEPLQERLFLIRIPEHSALVGKTVRESRFGELVGLTVGGILREGEMKLAVSPAETLQGGDCLLVAAEPERIRSLTRLGEVELESSSPKVSLESETVGVAEAAVAPRSSLAGRTLQGLRFRERFGLLVLALWREGRVIRENLPARTLRVGDALLLQGPWEKIRDLAREPDLVVLAPEVAQAGRRPAKAPFALAGLGLLVGLVVAGLQPIHVAAFAGATFVMLAGALTMEEAYRAIEWRAIFLVAAVLPVGIAMEESGAALLLARSVTALAGPLGPYAVLASLVVLSSLLSQGLDGAPAVVLLAPVALGAAEELGLSPYPIMMGVGLAASAAFMTPFSHKANLLVMGAGGYRAIDYVRVGTPLTLVVLILLVVFVPFFFPFTP